MNFKLFDNKYKYDIQYFIDKFDININIEGKPRKIKLRGYQKDLIEYMIEDNRHFVMGSRQVGITSCICLLIVRELLLSDRKNFAIISNKLANSSEILHKIKFMIKPSLEKNNIHFINNQNSFFKLSNDKTVSIVTVDKLEKNNFDFIWVDNFSYLTYIQQELLKENIIPEYDKNTNNKLIFTTTGYNNLDPLYLYLSSNEDYNLHLINWDAVPERGNEWKNQMINMMGENAFQREYEIFYR